jgi:hypothetical protein
VVGAYLSGWVAGDGAHGALGQASGLVDVAVEGGSVVIVVVVRHGDGLFVECVCMWTFVGCSN